MLKQLKSGFTTTINWRKYSSKTTNHAEKRYLDFSIDPIFQGVNRLFVLWFENENAGESYLQYYLLTVKIKNYNVMIDGGVFFIIQQKMI